MSDNKNSDNNTNNNNTQLETQAKQEFQKYIDFYLQNKQGAFNELTAGTLFGYCAGAFTRKLARLGVLVTGGLFVTTQFLSTSGYVNMEWGKMEQDAIKSLDQNGDNKLDMEDVKIIYNKYLSTLMYRVPSTAGFATAFMLGWRGKLI